MKSTMRIIVATMAMAVAAAAGAQSFPNRPVTLTVGFAPGGGTDTAARIVAQKLTENLGQSVVVENKAGAGGNIAAQHIAIGAPRRLHDPPHLRRPDDRRAAPREDLPYDPKRDIAPITMGVIFPNVFVVHTGVPAKTLAEFVALAKQKPGQLTYGSSGVGGAGHLAGELFKQRAGIDVVHIPYKGGGPAMTDLLGGRIDMYVRRAVHRAPHIEAGKARALATTGARRTSTLPNVPTIAESGYPGLRGDQLVRVRRARQDAEGDPRLLESRAGEGAERPAGEGRARQARPRSRARHARRTRAIHRPREPEVGQGRPGSENHRRVSFAAAA